jgi:hypothetical protein
MSSMTWFNWTRQIPNYKKSETSEDGEDSNDARFSPPGGILSQIPEGWERRPVVHRILAVTFQTGMGLMIFTLLYTGRRTLIRRLAIFDGPAPAPSQVRPRAAPNAYLPSARVPKSVANKNSGALLFVQTGADGPQDGYLVPASVCELRTWKTTKYATIMADKMPSGLAVQLDDGARVYYPTDAKAPSTGTKTAMDIEARDMVQMSTKEALSVLRRSWPGQLTSR